MIERLNQAISAALSITYHSQMMAQIHEFNFNMKKKFTSKKIKTFLILT